MGGGIVEKGTPDLEKDTLRISSQTKVEEERLVRSLQMVKKVVNHQSGT